MQSLLLAVIKQGNSGHPLLRNVQWISTQKHVSQYQKNRKPPPCIEHCLRNPTCTIEGLVIFGQQYNRTLPTQLFAWGARHLVEGDLMPTSLASDSRDRVHEEKNIGPVSDKNSSWS